MPASAHGRSRNACGGGGGREEEVLAYIISPDNDEDHSARKAHQQGSVKTKRMHKPVPVCFIT